jgi:hypothetical protein
MKDGAEKAQWNIVGTITEFPATEDRPKSFRLDLGMFPDTKFYVFDQKKKEETTDTDPTSINL